MLRNFEAALDSRARFPRLRLVALPAAASLLLVGCEGKINARLDNSIGLTTYENIGLIERQPIGVGLVLDKELRAAATEVRTRNLRYRMPVGAALGARLMTALALKFDRVQLLETPQFPANAPLDTVMIVTLKGLDASVSISSRWNTVATESSGWIEIEAILKDRQNQIVWIGTSRAEAEAAEESIAFAGAQDASAAMNQAIEKTVARLVAQMAHSGSLRDFIATRTASR